MDIKALKDVEDSQAIEISNEATEIAALRAAKEVQEKLIYDLAEINQAHASEIAKLNAALEV